MKNNNQSSLVRIGFLGLCLLFSSCSDAEKDAVSAAITQSLGLNFVATDTSHIESDLYLGAQGTASRPTNVDLTPKFPPIGNQEKHGTCVAWAAAYNLKTYLEGVDKQMSSGQLANPANQFSPKDLFLAIPSGDKGAGCNGTTFEAALDRMISRGVATQADVPYTNINCGGTAASNVSTYKIKNYRKIKHKDISELKSYLAGGRPIVFGAKLGTNFMSWQGNNVLRSDPTANNGQHGYHAMVLAGYDDARSAFKIVNSWGTNWGSQGYIWVDYTFFANNFCYAAYVVSNDKTNFNPSGGNGDANPSVLVDGDIDLIPWNLEDKPKSGAVSARQRSINYNVYNIGTSSISASKKWNIIYCIYDAYDANNFEILLYDYYTNEYGSLGQTGDMNTLGGNPHRPGTSGNWWNNINLAGGKSVSGTDVPFYWEYTMPNVSGEYYLVLIADGYDVLAEYDEDNNYFFITGANNEPIILENGVITSGGRLAEPYNVSKTPIRTLKDEKNLNAYTPQELKKLIKYQKEAGILEKKVKEYLAAQSTGRQKKIAQ